VSWSLRRVDAPQAPTGAVQIDGVPACCTADIDPKSGASALDEWLAGASGNYALQKECRLQILVAFELDSDAAQLSRVLKAIPGKRDSEWASKAKGRLDDAARKRIAKSSGQDRETRVR